VILFFFKALKSLPIHVTCIVIVQGRTQGKQNNAETTDDFMG